MNAEDKDMLYVNINGSAAEHVKECYGDLGWTVAGTRKKKRRKNTEQVVFCRPHFYPGKDDLLLLQVRLDKAFNQIGKLASQRKSRATWFGLILGAAAFLLVLWGAMIMAFFSGAVSIALGSVACVLGVLTAAVCGVLVSKIYKLDYEKCAEKIEKKVDVIEEICRRARSLRGADNEFKA